MNYLAGILGIALMGAVTTAAIFRGNAADYKAQLISLKASYASAADKARSDAQAQEAKDTAALKLQSSQAISQAQSGEQQAKNQLAIYLQKGNAASKGKVDMAHACFSIQVPSELLPGAK